jgi:hypothetical protein
MSDLFYLDCEFDGHDGPLISMAMINLDGTRNMYLTTEHRPDHHWVRQHVMPVLRAQDGYALLELDGQLLDVKDVGTWVRKFLENEKRPTIITDSPVDIWRFCQAVSTNRDGNWLSTGFELLTFCSFNVDCWPNDHPNAVQHNAWWDAVALRYKLTGLRYES